MISQGVAVFARRQVLGAGIDPFTMADAVARCARAIADGGYLSIGMLNAAKVIGMRKNEQLARAVAGCGMVLADGQSMVWAGRLLGNRLPERVAGIDLFTELLDEAARQSHRVYFLGARQEVLQRMLAEVGRRHPRLAVAGARDGYFEPGQEPEVVAHIRRSGAHVLFLGMTSPKKELFISRWGEATGANVVHGVGGSFDVLAGATRRAPRWCQDHGLEWLYRAWQEPGRLGRRYLTTNTAFIALVLRELMQRPRK
ncbi:MAG TPA: WecB/TagA/CpsF family glycosyltransferase [Streptosporangiaceae bacterium]